MKVKVKPALKTAGKRSMKARQKRLVKRAAYILRGVCKSRNWDTACKGCPVSPYCETAPYTWDLPGLPKKGGRK